MHKLRKKSSASGYRGIIWLFFNKLSLDALSLTIYRFKVENNSTASEWVKDNERAETESVFV